MKLNEFKNKLATSPEQLDFEDCINLIDSLYEFSPTAFSNGGLENEAGKNNGSCKIFAFAKQQGLDEQQTLNCFGRFYRDDVLQHPDADNHQNIRNFMKTGWAGIHFDVSPLTDKK